MKLQEWVRATGARLVVGEIVLLDRSWYNRAGVAGGLVAAAHSSQSGQRVRAVLTSSGEQVLGSLIAA